MGKLKDVRLIGTTSGAGAMTVTGDCPVGFLHAVEWVDGALDNNNTAVLSCINTPSGNSWTLLTVGAGEGDDDKIYYPRVLENDNACGNLATYTRMIVCGTLQLVVASGGAAHQGGCIVWVDTE